MESVVRAVIVYFVVLLLIRLSGRRTLGQLTAFDFVLLLVLSDTVQDALVGEDRSMTNAVLLGSTLLFVDVAMSLVKRSWPAAGHVIDGRPLAVVRDGKVEKALLHKARIDESEILCAARKSHGLEAMEDVRHAVIEADGEISIVPEDR